MKRGELLPKINPSIFIILSFLLTILVASPLVIAMDTAVKINTLPGHRIQIIAREAGTFTKVGDGIPSQDTLTGDLTFTLTSSVDNLDLKVYLRKDGVEVIKQDFTERPNGEAIFLNLIPGDIYIKTQAEVDAEAANQTEEVNNESSDSIESETPEEVPEEPEPEELLEETQETEVLAETNENPLTGFAITDSINVKVITYVVVVVVAIILILVLVIFFLKKRKKGPKNIKVTKYSDMGKNKLDEEEEMRELKDAEERLKVAQSEIERIKNKKSKIKEAEEKFMKDREELARLKRGE